VHTARRNRYNLADVFHLLRRGDVYVFYPGNTYDQTQKMLEVALEAWDEHLLECSVCPNKCLTDGFEITDMFDNLEKTGWPTV